MKKGFAVMLALALLLIPAARAEAGVEALTYAVYPYLPDPVYYQEIIERRWAVVEPEIALIRAEWDCYTGGAPEGIDVIMYDAVTQDALIDAGWIRPVDPGDIWDSGDIFPFALSGLTVDGELYGVPVFLCGNFLIYDRSSEALAAAERLPDLDGLSGILVVNSENPVNRPQYIIEAVADALGAANPTVDVGAEAMLARLDRLAVKAHVRDDDAQVALAYDAGSGQGYIGFSESIRLLERRAADTAIKSISFSDRPDTPRLYVDAAAVAAHVEGARYEKCMELINVMAGADVLTELSAQGGAPQYLLLARQSAYPRLSERFPLYAQLLALAGNENNCVILTP